MDSSLWFFQQFRNRFAHSRCAEGRAGQGDRRGSHGAFLRVPFLLFLLKKASSEKKPLSPRSSGPEPSPAMSSAPADGGGRSCRGHYSSMPGRCAAAPRAFAGAHRPDGGDLRLSCPDPTGAPAALPPGRPVSPCLSGLRVSPLLLTPARGAV